MRIGEVHALLREEFPTIELSKIRYYEDKGLVRPSRSRKGYRLYSAIDVDCLREAFRLAQEEFVPLRVVRQRLIEQGLLVDEPLVNVPRRAAKETATNIVSLPVRRESEDDVSLPNVAPLLALHVSAASSPTVAPDVTPEVRPTRSYVSSFSTRYDVEEFLTAAQISAETLADLEYFGFVSPREMGGERYFDDCDLAVAVRVRALSDRGVEIRHLQPLRRVVERQMDLLATLTAPLRSVTTCDARADGLDETLQVAGELAALRSILLERSMQEFFGK